ncbi:MAG TPA: hypothetical protein VJ739_09260 [Gemmataceae bacterium]|nr:hypothetical protein [Gemmataceae bacterium]
MTEPTTSPAAAGVRRVPLSAVVVVITAVYACSVYANLSFAVRNSADYRFFPPFLRHVDANRNRDLGAENGNIARSLAAGKGFASPFPTATGPTAWMPPAFPAVLAALLWASGGSTDAVMVAVVFLQAAVLIGTGLLVLALAGQTTRRPRAWLAVGLFLVGLLGFFRWCFQMTQDWWLVLLALDLLTVGLCWWRPLGGTKAAAVWGLFGGLGALVNPAVGLTWGLLSVLAGWRHRAWSRLALAGLVAGLTLLPWTVRNYLVFGRLIPVKSNLAYELYQSQCMQPDGLVQRRTLRLHPYTASLPEGRQYNELGETAYLDRKRRQFREAVASHPADFAGRVVQRFLGATLWYVPFERAQEPRQPWVLLFSRVTHPLPFLALLVLVGTARRRPLARAQWVVIGVYLVYLLPFVAVSYYERYAVPLLAARVLLVLWATDRLLTFRRAPRPVARTPVMANDLGPAVVSHGL